MATLVAVERRLCAVPRVAALCLATLTVLYAIGLFLAVLVALANAVLGVRIATSSRSTQLDGAFNMCYARPP